MPDLHSDPQLRPDGVKLDKDKQFYDPLGGQLDTYGKSPAHDFQDFIAYGFALSAGTLWNPDDTALPVPLQEIHDLRRQFVGLLVFFFEAYADGEIHVGESLSYSTPKGPDRARITWAAGLTSPDHIGLKVEQRDAYGSVIREEPALLSRDVLDRAYGRREAVVEPLKQYLALNDIITGVYKIRCLAEWFSTNHGQYIESVLNALWRTASEPHSDIVQLARTVATFRDTTRAAAQHAMVRSLSART